MLPMITMNRLKRSLTMVIVGLLSTWPMITDACGIAVHNEVSYRSIGLFKPRTPLEQRYKLLLSTFPGFMQAGSFFPDWGYQCLGYNQQSEDAHWAPFIKTAIQYVRETYPQPWSDPHVQGLIVFIFAVMSHDVADVKWHSLNGLDNYFVQAMAQMDFDGDYKQAHTVADAGAEFTLQHASPLNYLNETWQVPLQDLVNIYTLHYASNTDDSPKVPSKDHLRYCMTAAYAGIKLDLKFGKWLFNYYGAKSPFLVDQLNDYHKGGLQDLAASVSQCYRAMIQSFEEGVPDVLCSNYFDNGRLHLKKKPQGDFFYQQHDLDQLLSDNGIIAQLDDTTGLLTLTRGSPPPPPQQQANHQSVFQAPHFPPSSPSCQSVTPKASLPTLSISTSLAGYGHATVHGDFNGDGSTDLAISAPYHDLSDSTTMAGTVFIMNGPTHDTPPSTILANPFTESRFGWAMAVVDMNDDGIDDLAVSAPFPSGHVAIFYGSPAGLSTTPNRTLTGGRHDEGFGSTLARAGAHTLLVGCPYCTAHSLTQAGVVYMYGAEQRRRVFYSPTPMQYERFGSAMTVMDGGYTIIGAPGASVNNVAQVGKVYGFHDDKLQWVMAGQTKFEQFGSVLEGWRDELLVVSSPTETTQRGLQQYWQGGRIRLYDWHLLDQAQNDIARDTGLLQVKSGHQVSGHFGTSVSFFQDDQGSVGLWIGEPLGHQENGRIYRWMLTEEDLDCLEHDTTMARFGFRIINVGSGVICVTSQHDSHGARFSGAVHVYQFQ